MLAHIGNLDNPDTGNLCAEPYPGLLLRCPIVVDATRIAVRGELLWIDNHRFRNDTACLHFADILARGLKSLLAGAGHRLVRDESFDGLIVLPLEPRDVDLDPP
jgi:hypothetical protein